jgi:alpha-tubulin suppressor-like RCC1 family protein
MNKRFGARIKTVTRPIGLMAGFGLAVIGGFWLASTWSVSASPILDYTPVAKSIAAGGTHACAIYNDAGIVYCWGLNDHGQLGTGNTTDSNQPVAVSTSGALAGLKVKKVAAGFAHSCVIAGDSANTSNDKVYCWGANDAGQVGLSNTNTDFNTPQLIDPSPAASFKDIYAGFSTTCAVTTSDLVYCWGMNDEGQFGNGATAASPQPPTQTTGWSGVSDLSIGMAHACGVINNQVLCAGAGVSGQLGNGANSDNLTPVAVSGITGSAANVSTGFFMSCATTADGKFYCWGDNGSSQLGGSATNSARLMATYVTNQPIASGYAHSCAGFECIGENGSGQLGDGSTTNRSAMTPVIISGVLNGLTAKQVAAGFDFTCWIAGSATSDLQDAAFCAGAGVDGQLGNASNANSSQPVEVNLASVSDQSAYLTLSASADQIDLAPTPNGASDSDSLQLNVITNNLNGYSLQIKADPADLVCVTNSSAIIAPQNLDGAALETDAWGYGVSSAQPTAWNGVTTSDVAIDSSATATSAAGRDTTVWFGAKVSLLTPACSKYQGTVNFTATGVI